MPKTCQDSGGNEKATIYMDQRFAGSDSTMIKDRKCKNHGRIRAGCVILTLGAAMQLEDDDNTLEKSSVGMNAGHGGGIFFIWSSAALRMRGSRENSTTWHGYATGCQESIQPTSMWAPALVLTPLIGRHRSQCSWDAPVTPSNGVSSNACNASPNGDQPYYQALPGSTTICAIHSASNGYISTPTGRISHDCRASGGILTWIVKCFNGQARIDLTATGSNAFRRWDPGPAGSRTFVRPSCHTTQDSSSNLLPCLHTLTGVPGAATHAHLEKISQICRSQNIQQGDLRSLYLYSHSIHLLSPTCTTDGRTWW